MSLSDLFVLGAIRHRYTEDFSKSSSSSNLDYLVEETKSGIFVDKTYYFVNDYGVVIRSGSTYMILPCARTEYKTIVDKAACFHKSNLDVIYGNPKFEILLYLQDNGYNVKSSDLLRLSIPAIFTKAYPEFVINKGYADYK